VQAEWDESMDELAERRKDGRFARDSQDLTPAQRDLLNR
jgi:hypothetical protein